MRRTVSISDDVHTAMRLEAFEKKVSLQSLIDEVLQQHIKS